MRACSFNQPRPFCSYFFLYVFYHVCPILYREKIPSRFGRTLVDWVACDICKLQKAALQHCVPCVFPLFASRRRNRLPSLQETAIIIAQNVPYRSPPAQCKLFLYAHPMAQRLLTKKDAGISAGILCLLCYYQVKLLQVMVDFPLPSAQS